MKILIASLILLSSTHSLSAPNNNSFIQKLSSNPEITQCQENILELACRPEGNKCTRDHQCCDNNCWNGRCFGDTSGGGCLADGVYGCNRDADCCSSVCWYSECKSH